MERKPHEKSEITPIGVADFRNIQLLFGIKIKDKLQHIYAIGKTGVGKSTLLESMAISDIEQGRGICLADPHGDLASDILHYVPKGRTSDVIYFNPADTEYPVAFNPLADIPAEQHHLAASGLISTFFKLWGQSWGPRLEHTLRYSLLTLLASGGSTLLDIQPLLTNQLYRNNVLTRVNAPYLLAYWQNEFDKYAPAFRSEVISSVLNKVSLFAASDPLRNALGHKTSSFTMEQVLNEGKVLICNFSKGQLGEDASSLLGSMIINAMQLAALARAKQESSARTPFFAYIDECQSYLTTSVSDILSESRKYGLGLFLANQYTEQLDPKIRAAIFGNCGTLIAFRVGAEDSELLAKEFFPVFNETDLVNLPKYAMYLRLMIDGVCSKPFSATTQPLKEYTVSHREEVLVRSREQFARKPEESQETPRHSEIAAPETAERPSLFG